MFGGWKQWMVLGSLVAAGSSFMGCGGGDTTVDQGPRDMGSDEDSSVTDGGSDDAGMVIMEACQRDDLFMSAIDLTAATVTFTNPTDTDINLEDGSYQFCQGPGRYSAPPAGVVPAGGSLTVTVPSGNIMLDPTNGTLAFYNTGSFTTRDAMESYVCWGDGGGTPRLNVAQQVGSDGTVLWDEAGCVPLGGATTLYLRNGTAGNTASHYQTASVTFECAPEVPDGGVDGGAGDQGVSDGGVDGGLVSLLECDRTHLVIESVDTETNEITLYNPTGTAITTNGDYQLAHDLGFEAVPALTFPAYGRMTFDAPGIIELGANQTLALYATASFGTRDAMVDYMCWGTGGTRPYLSVARSVGSDGTVLWDDGGCTAAATDATVYRVPSTEGNTAADYTTVMPAEALDCSPPVAG